MNKAVSSGVATLAWHMILNDELEVPEVTAHIERCLAHNLPKVESYSQGIEAFLSPLAPGTFTERSEIAARLMGVGQHAARRAVNGHGDTKLVEEAHLFNLALHRLEARKVIDYASHRGYFLVPS